MKEQAELLEQESQRYPVDLHTHRKQRKPRTIAEFKRQVAAVLEYFDAKQPGGRRS